MNNPHDKFFKDSLGYLKIAKGFLKNYLPQNLIELMDFNNMVIDKNSFIDKELDETFSDLLYKVNLVDDSEAYLYFLFEHKSYPYPQITVQLLKYMTRIWELKIKQTKNKELPMIIPLVIYHGKRKWNIGLKLSDIIEKVPNEADEYFPNFKYLIYDLSHYSHEELKGEGQLRVFLEIISSFYHDDFETRLKEALRVLDQLQQQEKGIEYFETVIRYIINAKESMGVKDLSEIVKKVSEERSEEVMTIAEELKKEGKEEVAKNLLKIGMDIHQIVEVTELNEEQIKELKRKSQH